MIPKIIHYCWLSKEKKPDSIQRCIDSWRRVLPEYELKLWDIDSIDYNSVPFTKDALAAKKWAFVSDYVRLYALYNYGGIYLDSDVMAFGQINDLLKSRFFTGLEMRNKEHTDIFIEAAIMGAEKEHPFIKEALDLYSHRSFYTENGEMDLTPIPTLLSEIMKTRYHWIPKDETQHLGDGITVFSTNIIANSNCPRKKSVRLYHLNNRAWMQTRWFIRFIRSLKRYIKSIIKK